MIMGVNSSYATMSKVMSYADENGTNIPQEEGKVISEGENRVACRSFSESKASFTTEQIANMRTKTANMLDMQGYKYQLGDEAMTILFYPFDIDRLTDGEIDASIAFTQVREEGEVFRLETHLVNALREQYVIAKMFDIPIGELFTDVKIRRSEKGSIIADNFGDVYLQPLAGHISFLKDQGLTDEQINIELAGHIFHEAIHEADETMEKDLLEGNAPIGEITPVTAQLVYYLAKRYRGTLAYSNERFERGAEKMKKGEIDIRDYDIATFIAYTLVFNTIKGKYPQYNVDGRGSLYEQSSDMIERFSPLEKFNLPTLLREVITKAASREEIKTLQELVSA